jgi:5-methylcytosine-specific restriction enzyme subunit McrC
VSDEGPFLQGRLDVTAQLREGPRRDRLHCRHDEFTSDVLCNQVMRSTLEMLGRSPLVGDAVRSSLRQTLVALEPITAVALSPEAFSRALANGATTAYRPLLELSRLLFDGLHPAAGAGTSAGFLLDLERLFERHVTRGIHEAFAGSGFRVEEQLLVRISDSGVSLRPDVLIQQDERTHLVADAKWKHLRPRAVHPDDLYQILAYGSVVGARRLALVYPGRRDGWHGIRLENGIEVRMHVLRVTSGGPACRRSLQRLGRALRRWVASHRESRL